MITLVTGDLHLSDKDRDAYRHRFMETLPSIVRKHKVDRVIILGDLTEEKDRHNSYLVNTVALHIYRLKEAARLGVITLRGNHDYVDRDYPFFQWLQMIDGISWINTPTLHGGELFLPHTRNHQKDWGGALQAGRIFAHNTFAGAEDNGRPLGGGIPLDDLPKGADVISGDVHTPQTFGNRDKSVTYAGAPYTIDFGDDYSPRMLLIDKHEVTSIPCEGPQKRLVDIVQDGVPEKKPKGIITDWASYAGRPVAQGDIVKVRVTMKPEMFQHWAATQESIRMWAAKELLVLWQMIPVVDKSVKLATRRRGVPIRSDKQLLEDYAKARQVDKLTTKAGHRLMRDK